MMKDLWKKSFLACTLLFATNAHAEWSDYGTITHVESNNGAYRVWFSETINPAACLGSGDSIEAFQGETAESIAEMNKLILAAFLSGKEVRFSMHETACGPSNRPAYGNVRVRN